jgi:DnaK suppressor protein
MKQTEINRFKRILEAQRAEVLQHLQCADREAQSLDDDLALDSADQCVVSISKESLFERNSQRRTQIRLIEGALDRISEGKFGICLGCAEPIQSRRLEALPWTQFCLPCQEAIEDEVGASLAARITAPVHTRWKRVS